MSDLILTEQSNIIAIADAVRSKTGTTNELNIGEIIRSINGITVGNGLDTSDATATANDILSGKTAYTKGKKVTGSIATKTSSDLTASGATVTVPAGYYASQATKSVNTTTLAVPFISVDYSTGDITASYTQSEGYVNEGTQTAHKPIPTIGGFTYTPTEKEHILIAEGVLATGNVLVAPIPDEYMVGNEISAQDKLISQIQTALQGKAINGGSSSGGSDNRFFKSITISNFAGANVCYFNENNELIQSTSLNQTANALYGIIFVNSMSSSIDLQNGECIHIASYDWQSLIFSTNGAFAVYNLGGGA